MKKETINLIAENLKTLRTFKTLSQDEIAEQIARTLAGIVMVPEFSNKKIPVKVAAKIYGKSEYLLSQTNLE